MATRRSDDSANDYRWAYKLAALTGWAEYVSLNWTDERAYPRGCSCTYDATGKVLRYCFKHFQEEHYGPDINGQQGLGLV